MPQSVLENEIMEAEYKIQHTLPIVMEDSDVAARVNNYSGATVKYKRLCSALGNNFFEYVKKASSDKMQSTWENIIHHVGLMHTWS